MKTSQGSLLGDKRLEKVAVSLVSRQMKTESVVLRQLGESHSGAIQYGRFLGNERFSCSSLGTYLLDNQYLSVSGLHVLSIQDSTEVDMSHRGSSDLGLGSIGNGLGYGYYLHPHLLLDATDGRMLGLGSLSHWVRADNRSAYRQEKLHLSGLSSAERKAASKAKAKERNKKNNEQGIETKEGYRWLSSARESVGRLGEAGQVTVVADCEADTFEYIVGLCHPDFRIATSPPCEVLVRSDNNRLLDISQKVYDESKGKMVKKKLTLYAHLKQSIVRQSVRVEIGDSPQRSKRTATFELKFERVKICRPKSIAERRAKLEGKPLPKYMEVTAIEFREVSEVPQGEKPICWVLLTTHLLTEAESALKIVKWYQMRWRIELYFKALKTKGFCIENILLETKERILKLAFCTLMAATKIIQLLQARDNPIIEIETAFSKDEIECLHKILPTLEGKTDKLKNPFDPQSLAYATWIIARLGGWSGYSSQRKPGIYTLKVGLIKFKAFFDITQSLILSQN